MVDDFNDAACGWDQYEEEEASAGYSGGEYLITVHQPGASAVAVPGAEFSDVSVQAEARLAQGSANNNLGLLCRYQDMDHFYGFLISSDGYYAIVRVDGGGSYRILSGDGTHLLPSDAIRTEPGTVNQLQALCAGDELTLYVNGRQLASVSDNLFTSGDIGFIVSTYEEAPTSVSFDNLVVQEPAMADRRNE